MIVRYATFQLFFVINCIFETPILPSTKYLIDKLYYLKKWAHFHAICIKRRGYAGMFQPRKDRYVICQACNNRDDIKNYDDKHFFITMDASSLIAKLIECNSGYYNFVMNERVYKKGFMNDIYDGKMYRNFVKSLSEADKHQYATATFNTDGAPLFESSTCSIWPIYLMVNELPYNVRTKELVLVGLWFGKDKPDMNVFLAPFVEHMNQLSTTGIECNINGIRRCIRLFPLVCCVDSVARAPVQGFVQFNGKNGCGLCLHPGMWVQNSSKSRSGGCMKYPLLNTVVKNRSMADTILHAEEGTPQNPVFGVKSRSPLIDLMKFDLIRGCVPDSMHACTGVAKQIAKSLFGTKEKVGILSRRLIPTIDNFLANIKCPHQVGRLTRPFSEKEFWKAREWENWTLYFSLPILFNIVPREFLMHWSLFVEALYILSQAEIRNFEIDLADRLLHKFVAGTEKLYSKVAMTFNVHLLLHLSKSVYDWGPLWAHNAFAFESGNGQLLKGIHSAKGMHHQICRRISLQYSLCMLKKNVNTSVVVKKFCTTLGTKIVQKTFQLNSIRYFGLPSAVNRLWIVYLGLSLESTVSYTKMVKNGCLFTSSGKTNTRSDNTYAMLKDNSYVKLNYFILDRVTKKEYTIVQKLVVVNVFNNEYTMLKKIVDIESTECAVLTNLMDKICVHIAVNENEYLCAMPNLYSY